jgi:hypothetical protein
VAKAKTLTLRVKDSAFLKKARERFKWANDSDTEQAKRERDDIAFEAGEQWPADIQLARAGQQPINGMPAVPARPTLVINKVKQPVQKILNQERESDIGVMIVPADDFGDLGVTPDDTEITLREGLVRRIQRHSKASDARSWAFKRALIAGRGYYQVMTRYLPGTWNQEVYVHKIYNQAGVLLDPSHEANDGSDADFEFVGTWMPWDRYQSEFGVLADGEDNPFNEATEADFVAMSEQYPDWYKADGEQRAVRVVDYWYKERTSRELALMEDGSTAWVDELPEGVKPADTRREPQVQIKFCKIGGGVQILEETDWPGPDMPIIKVIGEEILPYDNERRYEGMVRPAIGPQMGLNYMVSKQVETVGLSPIAALTVDPEAIEGYEAWYAVANTRALPYLPARTYDEQGRAFKEPHRPQVDPNIMAVAQSVGLFNQAIQDTTAVQDPAMGKTDPSVKSNRHAETLIAESAQGTSNWMDNLKRSLEYEAQVENNLLYPIYGANPGRLVRIVTGEGEAQQMRVSDGEGSPEQAAMQQKAIKVAKLTKDANFNVSIKISSSTENRRNQFVRMFGDILGAAPEQMGVGGDLFYLNMDIPEAKQLAKRQKVMLHPQVQALLAQEAEGTAPIPPEIQAQMAQMQEQIAAAEAALAEALEQAKGKTMESETKLRIAQLEAERDIALKQAEIEADARKEMAKIEADLEMARMDNATKQYVADVQAKTKGQMQASEHAHNEMATDTQLAHESEQAQLDREGQERQAERAEMEAERNREFEASRESEA